MDGGETVILRLIKPNSKDITSPVPVVERKTVTIYMHASLPFVRGLVVCAVFIIPICTHAGMFSSLFGFIAEAEVEEAPALMESPQHVPLLKAVINSNPQAARGGGDILVGEDGVLIPTLGPDAVQNAFEEKEGTGEIQIYVVQESESLSVIAEKFGVSVNTILWANEIKNPNTIRPGDTLIILPVSGVRHVVKKGDTIAAIAKKYGGDVTDILAYNSLVTGAELVVGTTVVIPGGEVAIPKVADKKKSTAKKGATGSVSTKGYFIRPLPSVYPKTQGIHGYNGVDIGAPIGTEVHAAAAGTVILSRSGGSYNGGYGNYVVIKHANGTQTLYAHLNSILVSSGDTVSQGEAIGYSGNTGRSTGAHLHFEVRGGKNPF